MLQRFLLVIMPVPVLAEKVLALRAALHARIGGFSGRNTPPHITLCFLDLPEAMEQQVVGAVASGTAGLRAFMLHYNGITHFPDKRTIYIDPVEKQAIAAVRTPIIAALKAQDALQAAVRETGHPHLTIAAGLKPDKFPTAWEMLAPHRLLQEERVGEVVLMKRLLQIGSMYGHVRSFPLG